MIKYVLLLSLAILGYTRTVSAQVSAFDSMSFIDLQTEMAKYPQKTLIINFWATWCKPCIEELPYFEQVNQEFKDKNVEVWLVNLDFNSAVEKVVKPFIEKRNIKSRVIHLTDTDPNEWIDKINKDWGGNIPATLIIKNGNPISFHPNQLEYKELVNLITK